jgi:hypothetical protein
MDRAWYTLAFPLVHVDVRNRCPRCEAAVRRWARRMGVDPDLIVWGSRGLHETPIRVVVEQCDQLRFRGRPKTTSDRYARHRVGFVGSDGTRGPTLVRLRLASRGLHPRGTPETNR